MGKLPTLEELEETFGENEETVEGEIEQPKVPFDFGKLLSNPLVADLLSSGKDLFKKEKADPNVCEISIKAPSEVVLKLFGI